jgi:ABC-type Mn2+/Zn2+ transport system ATPase subunit
VEDIFNIFDELKSRKVTLLVSLHNLRMAARRFDQVMLLNHRMLGIGAPADVLNEANLLQAYGGQLHQLSAAGGTLALDDTCCDHEDEH